MASEKDDNKSLRICGNGSVRKNKGKWQAIVTLIDEGSGERTQRTRNTGIACFAEGTRGKKAALDALADFRREIEAELAEIEKLRAAGETRSGRLRASPLRLRAREVYRLLPANEPNYSDHPR